MDKHIQAISALVFSSACYMFGHADGMLYALITLMILDYISGVIRGAVKKKLSSSVGYKGILKKSVILIMVSAGHIADSFLPGSGNTCRSAVIGFYAANEGLSILENASAAGLPLPKKLKSMLIQLREENDK